MPPGGRGDSSSSGQLLLPNLVNGRGEASGHVAEKRRRIQGAVVRSGQLLVTQSLPALPNLPQRTHCPNKHHELNGMRLTRYSRFLRGYLRTWDSEVEEPGFGRLPNLPGSKKAGHHAWDPKVHRRLSHVEDKETDKVHGSLANSFALNKQSATALSEMRHKQLKQRRLQAAPEASEPPWDALGANGYISPSRKSKSLREVKQQIGFGSLSNPTSIAGPSLTPEGPTVTTTVDMSPQHRSVRVQLDLGGPDVHEESEAHMLRACQELCMLVYGEALPESSVSDLKTRRRGYLQDMEPLTEFLCRPNAEIKADFVLKEFLEYFRTSKSSDASMTSPKRGRANSADDDTETHVKCCIATRLEDLRRKDMTESGETWMSSLDKCSLAEMLRMFWPGAGPKDILAMKALMTRAMLGYYRIKSPSLLPQEKHTQLKGHYAQLESRGENGVVFYNDLIEAGLVDAETSRELRHRYDVNRDGMIQLSEFLEMLCPNGFRVHEKQCRALAADGQPMSCLAAECGGERFSGWLLDSDVDRIPVEFYQMVDVKFPDDHPMSPRSPSSPSFCLT